MDWENGMTAVVWNGMKEDDCWVVVVLVVGQIVCRVMVERVECCVAVLTQRQTNCNWKERVAK